MSETTLSASNLYDALKEVERVIDESKFGTYRLNKKIDLAAYLNIPVSKQQEITNHHSNESQRKHAIIEEFINNHPAPSWRLVAEFLYKNKYNRALQIVKQKYLKVESRHLFNEAMKSGSVRSHNTVALLVGSAGSGKTCSKHVILNEQPPEVRVSTAVAERPVKVMKVLTINGLEWHRLTPMQQKEILARIMASRGKKKVDLAVSQLPIRVDYPEPTKKTESKSAHPPPESGSSFPETETTKTSTAISHTTTTAARQKSGEDSSEVLLNSPTTEEDFVALIDNSSGSEPIMEVNFIHLVDSGGQPQFHEVLPAFLRRRSAYIFVVNLSEKLDTRPQIEYYDHRGKLICKACPATHTNLQIFMHCIRTLQSHRFGGKAPNIFVFGTHRDLEHMCSETRAAKNRKLAEMLLPKFEDEVVYYNVGRKELIFPLDAKLPKEEDWETAREIRKLIMEKCSPPADDTPLRWYGLEIALQEMAEARKRGVMSKEECFTVALRLHFDRDSFEAALQHLDELNIIFYYPNILPDAVFIDVQVLLDKVTELVKLSYELQNKDADSAIMAKGGEYRKFQDYALVTSEFLASDRFKKHYFSDLFTPLELVKLFRALLIFADFSDTEYFMPCLLRMISSEEVAKHRLSSSTATAPLILHFPHGGPLLGMFCSLIVYLLSSANQFPSPWKLVVDSLSTPLCLHRNCVKFTIPKYPGTVSLVDSFSFFEVHVTSHGKICSQICSFVCNAVFTGLRKAATNLGYNNSQPEIAYICPCQSEGLHPAIVGEGETCWICTRDPNTFGDIDEKQQMWLTASAKALQHHPTSTTAVDPPVITRHPESQSVATRADTMFRVQATGDELQFQWQKDKIDIDSTEPRFQCNSAGTVSTLHIKDTSKSDKGHYRCLITNPVEKKGMLSTEADLLVFDPPEITEGPESQSVATGADTTFRVEVTGDEIEFQWQKEERNIDGNESRFNFIRTEDTSTFCIQHTKKSDKGHYRCLVKNPVEKKGKPSKKADLSVFDPPKITRDPESQSVATGTYTTFRVQATGDDLQFQWQKDKIDIDSSELRTQCNSTGDASTLHIQHTEKSDKGHYRCLIKNPVEKRGKASQEANLTVFYPPKIIRDPESHSVATGADTMFRVQATGDELQFQWQKDKIDIDSTEPRFQCKSAGTVSTLYIQDTNKSDKGHYRCLITNPVEKKGIPSAEANLSVFDPPEITQDPESQSVATGADATFRVEATGIDLQFQWQKDERNIDGNKSRFDFSRTEDTSMLCIQHTKKSDKGCYRCLIKNPVEKKGKPSKKADLSVFDPLKITRDPESQSVATGTHTSLRVQATGDDLQFQWQKDKTDIDTSEPRTQCNSTGDASTLYIKHTKKSDKGRYRCLVKNPIEKMGKASQEANLSVFYPPEITQDPESQSVATGTHTSLRVQATGDDLQFQWQKDKIDIEDSETRTQCNSTGNASTLYIKHTEKSDKGRYRCLIKNPIEKIGKASQEANLSVFYSPEITQGPESQSVATGTDTTFTVEVTGDDIEFQWQKNERNITDNESRFKVSNTKDTSTLCVRRVQKSDKGHYRCLIKNPVEKNGKYSHEAELTVWCNYKQILLVGGILCLLLLAVLGVASHMLVRANPSIDPQPQEEAPFKFDDSLHHPALPHSEQPAVPHRSKTSHPPNLPTLRRFPVKNGFIDIAAKIGTDYELFGTLLLQDDDGNKVKTIERSERGDPLRITVEILRQWLQGNGKLPVNWQTLVQCLQDSNLNVISDSIKVSLLENNLSNELELAHSDEL